MKTDKKQTIQVVVTIEEFKRDYYKTSPCATDAQIRRAYNRKHKK